MSAYRLYQLLEYVMVKGLQAEKGLPFQQSFHYGDFFIRLSKLNPRVKKTFMKCISAHSVYSVFRLECLSSNHIMEAVFKNYEAMFNFVFHTDKDKISFVSTNLDVAHTMHCIYLLFVCLNKLFL